MKIIYPTDNGITVLTPSGIVPVIQTALADVPAGVPFCIVPDDAIPSDRSSRAAWTADFSSPDGYGGDYGAGSEFGVYGRDKNGNARLVAKGISGGQIFIDASSRSTAACRAEVAAVTQEGNTTIITKGKNDG